jgi:hypothetical protein
MQQKRPTVKKSMEKMFLIKTSIDKKRHLKTSILGRNVHTPYDNFLEKKFVNKNVFWQPEKNVLSLLVELN